MKKTITMVMALAASLSVNAQTQVGNSGFENWESVTGGAEPVNWNSFLTASGSLNGQAANQIQESTDIRPGSTGTKSMRIWSRNASPIPFVTIVANGNATVGQINMGSTSAGDATNNYNKTVVGNPTFSEAMTDKPDSLVFWVKFTPNGHNQNARVKATIHDNNQYQDPESGSVANYVVGSTFLNFTSTGGNWVRKSIPFTYSGPATTASYILITFTTNETPGGGAANDQVWVDDMELVYVPKALFTSTASTICEGSTVTYTNASTQYPTSYSWSFPGGTPATSTDVNPVVTYNTSGTYNAVLTATNQWGSTTHTITNHVTVNPSVIPTFTYNAASYCSNVSNPVPTTSAAGSFSATPSGLVFADATTGEIDLAASTAGTYTITNAPSGACTTTATGTVTIFQGADASFNYSANTLCLAGGNQTPTVTTAGGTFSSTPAGLIFANATTGEIDVNGGSIAGTYDVSYVVGGACPDTVTTSITLTDTPDATFTYAQSAYCDNALTNPSPVFPSGASAGTFSSTTGLSINASNGAINLAASTAGTYTVTNDIAAVASCPAATHTYSVTINAAPTVSLTLAEDTVCSYHSAFLLSGGLPAGGSYSGTGVAANIFNPASVTQGTVTTITYTYTNTSTTCSNTATAALRVDACAGIEDTDMEAVTIYPNPTNGLITIDNMTQSADYKVISVTGQVVETGSLTPNNNKVDLTKVQNGIYVLQLQQGTNIQTVRIVKQ